MPQLQCVPAALRQDSHIKGATLLIFANLLVLPTLTWLLGLQVVKYTAPEMSHLFETALGAWEVAAATVLERQR